MKLLKILIKDNGRINTKTSHCYTQGLEYANITKKVSSRVVKVQDRSEKTQISKLTEEVILKTAGFLGNLSPEVSKSVGD